MDSKFYVSLEAARLLKEKGCDKKCLFAYADISNGSDIDVRMVFNSNDYPVGLYPCPTKAEAIDWLESKGIYVATSFTYSGKWLCTIYSLNRDEMVSTLDLQTRLEAEEAAIIKACELL